MPLAPSLTLRAGPDALALLRERGLRAEDVDVLPGASGGAKWLAIAGLDRFLFGEFFRAPRARPLHCIGSSIGSWRMACLAQRDPVAALERGHRAYVHEQRYSAKPSPREITEVLSRALDRLLGPAGAGEILEHPWARLHVITAEARGLAGSARRPLLAAGMAVAAAGNLLSRRALAWQLRRVIFHSCGDATPFRHLADLPTAHVRLTRDNVRAALLASGSIPLLVEGVRMPSAATLGATALGDAPFAPNALGAERLGRGGEATYWDGGVLDYHLDLDFGPGDGLVLYPHFYAHVVPGWFDRALRWRRSRGANFRRALLVAPSAAFVASLPGAKIPDRRDFYGLTEGERVKRWQGVVDATERLGDELRELIASGRVAERVEPW